MPSTAISILAWVAAAPSKQTTMNELNNSLSSAAHDWLQHLQMVVSTAIFTPTWLAAALAVRSFRQCHQGPFPQLHDWLQHLQTMPSVSIFTIGCSTIHALHLTSLPTMPSVSISTHHMIGCITFKQCHQCPFSITTWLAAAPSNNSSWIEKLWFFCWCVNDFFVNAWMIFVDVWMVSQSCGEGDVCALLLLRRWRCCSQSYADDDDDGHLEILLTWLKVG